MELKIILPRSFSNTPKNDIREVGTLQQNNQKLKWSAIICIETNEKNSTILEITFHNHIQKCICVIFLFRFPFDKNNSNSPFDLNYTVTIIL